jgi:protein phosphatase
MRFPVFVEPVAFIVSSTVTQSLPSSGRRVLFSAGLIFSGERAPIQTIFAMLSDRGRVRRHNEDACAAALLHNVFVVCDGMGGAAGGEIASHLAAEIFVAQLSQSRRDDGTRSSRTESEIAAAVQAANRAVYQQARKTPQLSGMGTTLVGLVHASPQPAGSEESEKPVWLVHVGDSRCYRWRQKKLEQLTVDHSLVEEQVRAGQITAAQALESPMRNVITRAVGTEPTAEPEIQRLLPQEGDLYLLTSDGLTRELSDNEIASILCRISGEMTQAALQSACQKLVEAANERGGNDNITVLLVGFVPA